MILIGFNLSIGTPSQSFQVCLSVESGFLMLQSADCKTDPCQQYNHTGFNNSQSSTFHGTPYKFYQEFAALSWEGHRANETVGVGGLRFPSVPFLLAEYISPIGWLHFYGDYDGVLGLSPLSPAWIAMQESGLLEENIIGLKFPSGPFDVHNIGNRDDGELVLGGISPDFSSAPFIDLPLADGYFASWWATPVQGLTIVNGTDIQPYPLPKAAVAGFVSANPFITLPSPLVQGLMNQVLPNSTGVVAGFLKFPCEIRQSLANVELSLGEGDLIWNITLSPYDYSVRIWNAPEDPDFCVLVAYPGPGDIMSFGWPLLRRFYSVFDNGRKLIRCKLLPIECFTLNQIAHSNEKTVTPKPDID